MKFPKRIISWFQKNGSTVLTCLGAGGVVATVIFAIKATPKAQEKIINARRDKADGQANNISELPKLANEFNRYREKVRLIYGEKTDKAIRKTMEHEKQDVEEDRPPWDATQTFPMPGQSKRGFVSVYQGEEVGEGGYVYAEPGMYVNLALLDIASMQPHDVIGEPLFAPTFTKRFKEIVDGRVSMKRGTK